jgi:hypothetical protein
MIRTLSVVPAVAALAGLLIAGSAPAARQSGGSCIATYTFDRLSILRDDDDRGLYASPDKWTIHTYVFLHTVSTGTTIGSGSERNFGVLKGVGGDTISVGWHDLDHAVIGKAGEDVRLNMPPGGDANRVKEVDPPLNKGGVASKHVAPYGLGPAVIAGCTPGTYKYSAQADLQENDEPGEADALAQLDFTLALQNGRARR